MSAQEIQSRLARAGQPLAGPRPEFFFDPRRADGPVKLGAHQGFCAATKSRLMVVVLWRGGAGFRLADNTLDPFNLN